MGRKERRIGFFDNLYKEIYIRMRGGLVWRLESLGRRRESYTVRIEKRGREREKPKS